MNECKSRASKNCTGIGHPAWNGMCSNCADACRPRKSSDACRPRKSSIEPGGIDPQFVPRPPRRSHGAKLSEQRARYVPTPREPRESTRGLTSINGLLRRHDQLLREMADKNQRKA
jgi:hypothetical protein